MVIHYSRTANATFPELELFLASVGFITNLFQVKNLLNLTVQVYLHFAKLTAQWCLKFNVQKCMVIQISTPLGENF